MRHQYIYGEEAKVTSRPPGNEMHAYDTGENFERPSVGIVERRGCLALEGASYFVGEEGETRRWCPSARTTSC